MVYTQQTCSNIVTFILQRSAWQHNHLTHTLVVVSEFDVVGSSLEQEAVVQREESAEETQAQLDRLFSPLCREGAGVLAKVYHLGVLTGTRAAKAHAVQRSTVNTCTHSQVRTHKCVYISRPYVQRQH